MTTAKWTIGVLAALSGAVGGLALLTGSSGALLQTAQQLMPNPHYRPCTYSPWTEQIPPSVTTVLVVYPDKEHRPIADRITGVLPERIEVIPSDPDKNPNRETPRNNEIRFFNEGDRAGACSILNLLRSRRNLTWEIPPRVDQPGREGYFEIWLS